MYLLVWKATSFRTRHVKGVRSRVFTGEERIDVRLILIVFEIKGGRDSCRLRQGDGSTRIKTGREGLILK